MSDSSVEHVRSRRPQVKEAGKASEVTIHVDSPKDTVTQAEVEKFLTQALTGLEKQVSSN